MFIFLCLDVSLTPVVVCRRYANFELHSACSAPWHTSIYVVRASSLLKSEVELELSRTRSRLDLD
jgi:hypothetical protein